MAIELYHQFQYNPEWFEEEDEEADEDWDIQAWREKKEAEDVAAEERRVAEMGLDE